MSADAKNLKAHFEQKIEEQKAPAGAKKERVWYVKN